MEIVDVGRYTDFLTPTRLYVVEDRTKLAAFLDVFQQGRLLVSQTGFGLLTSKRLRWFTEAGVKVGELMTREENGVNDADVDALVLALSGQLGRIPTADEVVTLHLDQSAATHAEAWNWGLYRNARFGLAESCARRGLREDALPFFLEVSLIDSNGPRNLGTKDPQITRRYPPFDPSTADLAPGVVSRTADLMAELNLTLDDTRRVFETLAGSVGPKVGLPRSTADAWRQLSSALAGVQR